VASSAVQSEIVIDQSAVLSVNERTDPLAIMAFLCSAIGVGLLLGTGPVSIFVAPLGVLLGVVALMRSRAGGRKGLAVAAIVIGATVTLPSLAFILGSQAT